MENTTKFLTQDCIFDDVSAVDQRWWLFVDWNGKLNRQTSIQGIIIYAMKQTYGLAKLLGKEKEVTELPGLVKSMTQATRKTLYDRTAGVFVSGSEKQVSYASQAWMILSGVATKAEGQRAFKALPDIEHAVYPGGPYLYHYVIEAMIQCEMYKEAKNTVVHYWGGMVKKGADTFWEVYDPNHEELSPYNFYPVNSYCHAWSCSPVYFIRKFPAIFQQ